MAETVGKFWFAQNKSMLLVETISKVLRQELLYDGEINLLFLIL